jgi:hypothetical protein
MVFEREARPELPDSRTSLRLWSRFRVLPERPRSTGFHPCRRSPEVLCPLSATQSCEPPLPGFAFPGHVASLPFQPASTPFSRHDLPGIFHPGALTGFLPSKLDLAKIASTSRWCIPSCDWQNDFAHQRQRWLHGGSPECRLSSSPFARRRPGVERPPFLTFLSVRSVGFQVIHGTKRRRRDSLSTVTASLQGFLPFAGWDCLHRVSPELRRPGSPGISSSLGPSPSPSGPPRPSVPAFLSVRRGVRRPRRHGATVPSKRAGSEGRLASSQVLREGSRSGSLSLYFRVSKNREIGWPLPRLPAPSRFPSSSRSEFPVARKNRRVSDRPSDPHLQVHFQDYRSPKDVSTGPRTTFCIHSC